MGATGAEVEEAAQLAKETAAWSTYLNTLRLDFERFKDELRRAVEFIKNQAKSLAS